MAELRRVTVRFGPALHSIIEGAARAESTSLAGYVREAAAMRSAWESALARTADQRSPSYLDAIRLELRELARAIGASDAEGTVAEVQNAVTIFARDELNAVILRLDERAPVAARAVREMYGIPEGGFADG